MGIFKNAWFRKFSRKEKITDPQLCDAVERAEQGFVDADLGGGVIKQRVARQGSGRSGGFRTLLFYKKANRAVFVFGFAKSDRANIGASDERDLKAAAKLTLAFSEAEIDRLLELNELEEVFSDAESQNLPQ